MGLTRYARRTLASALALACAAGIFFLLAPFGARAAPASCVLNVCTLTDTTVQDFASGQFYLTGLRNTSGGEVGLQPIGITSPWVTDQYHLPEARSEMAVVIFKDILYVIGGFYTNLVPQTSTIYTAATALDGSILAPGWLTATTDSLPAARVGAAAVVSPTGSGGFLYVLGGRTANGASGITSTLVYKGLDGAGAFTGAWQTAPMPPVNGPDGPPVALVYLQAVVRGGYLYVVGGFNGTFTSEWIYRAPLNVDGSPGTWVRDAHTIPDAGGQSGRSSFAVAVGPNAGGTDYLYVLAGQTASLGSLTSVPDVDFAPFNNDGSLGVFSITQPLPALYGHGAAESAGQIFVSGGSKGVGSSVIISEVQSALIDEESGVLRDLGGGAHWQTTTPLAQPRQYHGTAVNSGGEIYVIGGEAANGAPTDTVFRGGSGGSGQSYASSGNHTSRVIDLAGLYQLNTLKWNTDVNGGANETITLQYRSAANQNALLAQAWSTAGTSAPGTGITNTFTFTGVAANYLQYRALFTITAPFNHTPALNAVEVRYSSAGPDLQVLSASDGVSRAHIGDVLTYTIVYTNTDSRVANGVVLSETPPLSTTFVSGTAGWTPAGGLYRLPLGSLAPHTGGVATFTVKVNGKPLALLLNNIVVIGYDNALGQDPNLSNNSFIDTDALDFIDLQITSTDFKSDLVVSSTNTYSITYGNAGTIDAPNVVITSTIPPGARYLGGPPWTPAGNGQFVFPVGTVAVGPPQSIGFSIFVSNTNVGQAFTQSVKITTDGSQGPDADSSNNVFSDYDNLVPAGPDLAVSLSDGRAAVGRGNVLTYTIGIANVGGSMAPNVLLTETLPANSTFVGPGDWSAAGGGTYTRTLGDISAGNFTTVQFIVKVDIAAPLGPFTNTAVAATAGENNLVLGDNTATDVDTVSTQFVDLSVQVSDGLSSPSAGQVLTYVVNFANLGNGAASGVVLTATLSPGLSFAGSGWSALGGGQFSRNVGSLAAGAANSVTLQARVDFGVAANTYLSNSVTIDFAGQDAYAGNNTDTDVDFISPPIMSLQLDDGVAGVAPGQTLNYVFQYRNTGSVTATNIILTETLPLNGTSIADASGWAPNGSNYTRAVPDLGPGSTGTAGFGLKVVNNATAGTLITNTGGLHAGNQSAGGVFVSTDVDIVVSSPPSDLQVTAWAPARTGLGVAASVFATVTNSGASAAGTWFSVEVYLDRIPQSRSDLGDAHVELGDLASGAHQVIPFSPVWSTPGTHFLYFQVDTCDLVDPGWCTTPSYGRIPESNEANNVYGPLTVAVLPLTIYFPVIAR